MSDIKQNRREQAGGSTEQVGSKIRSSSEFTTIFSQNQESNIFEAAAARGGTITHRQLRALDWLRSRLDSDAYNEFRESVGIPAWTANYRLSKQQAVGLIRVILAARSEAGK